MALSKSETPLTTQPYLVCGTKDCKKDSQFYCNPCHRPMCEKYRDEHQKSPEPRTMKWSDINNANDRWTNARFTHRDMFCEQYQAPLCSKSATNYHRGHIFIDMETVMSDSYDNRYVWSAKQG